MKKIQPIESAKNISGRIKIFKLMSIFQAFWEMFSRNSLECPILKTFKKYWKNLIVSLNANF
jgi:hypothetical protein